VICVAAALQIALIKEKILVAAVLSDVQLSSNNVIDVGTRLAAFTQLSDLAQRIAGENMRNGSSAPLRRVIKSAESGSAALAQSIAIGVSRSALGDCSWSSCRHSFISRRAPALY
jgi:hypothetical protein